MYIQPSGRTRNTKRRGRAVGLVLMGFGALIFLTMIHGYTQRAMSNVRTEQAAPEDYEFHTHQTDMTPASDHDERSIQSVISAQTRALKQRNFALAMSYSSIPFPQVTPAMFQGYLESRYPENAAPRSVVFSDKAMTFEQNFAIQRVRLTGLDGTTINEMYLLIKTDLGWRVRRFHVVQAGEDDSGGYFHWDQRR